MNKKLKIGLEVLMLGAATSFLIVPNKYTDPILAPVIIPIVNEYKLVREQLRFLPDNASIISSLEQKTEANQYLTRFPEMIPGAGSISKYEVANAKYCLVHVRQKHPGEGSRYVDQMGEETRTIQYEVYQILDSLRQNQGIKGVYAEGFVIENQKEIEEEIQELRKWDAACASSEEKSREKQKKCRELSQLKAEQFGPTGDGVTYVLALEGKLEAYPAESMAVRSGWLYDRIFKRERENYVLSLITQKFDPVAVTVYGAGHDFGDTIVKWNTEHPNKKFSLIEITPQTIFEKYAK